MQAIFQSSFLQALGFAIANSLWQTALVWLLYSLLSNLLTMSAAIKYRLVVAAQILSFTWFIITLQFYYQQYQHAWQQSALRDNFSQNSQAIQFTTNSLSSQIIKWMVMGEQLLPYLSMAYLLLILLLSIRWFFGYQNTQKVRKSGLAKMPAEWRVFVKKIAGQLHIKKEIRVYLSDLISTPMTIGFLKPIILIPLASINHLTTQQLEAVILHELAHIKRYDYPFNLILSVIDISLFFNPFTQLLSKQIKKKERIAAMIGYCNFNTMQPCMQKHCCKLLTCKILLNLRWPQQARRMNCYHGSNG
jgi:bla regulator protein blaR1